MSYLVPPNSPIVSSKGKNGIEMIYTNKINPIRPNNMKLVILINENSEIVARKKKQ